MQPSWLCAQPACSVSWCIRCPLESGVTCANGVRRIPANYPEGGNNSTTPAAVGVGDGESTCRRGSVHRALAGVRVGDHLSVRPTREDPRADHPLPVRPCSGWGLPSRPGHPGRWCALTAPFHPHLCLSLRRVPSHRRSVLCGTFLRVTPTGCEPASCPMEPRPSSARTPRRDPAAVTRSTHRRVPVWREISLASPCAAN